MKAFADLYTALAETNRTGEKVAALARYFSVAAPADAAWAVDFLSGRRPRQAVPSKRMRLWARELFEGYLHEGFADFGYSGSEVFRQSDLQIAALGWLAQHRQFAALASEFGTRIATLDADRLASFRKLRAEAAYAERKADPLARASAVARHKTALKTMKFHPKSRNQD